jgi:hypothetical protein
MVGQLCLYGFLTTQNLHGQFSKLDFGIRGGFWYQSDLEQPRYFHDIGVIKFEQQILTQYVFVVKMERKHHGFSALRALGLLTHPPRLRK